MSFSAETRVKPSPSTGQTNTVCAEVICVGTELLLGDILNGNAQFMAQQLAELGIAHYFQTVVGDNPQRLQQAIAIASGRANLLIFTGGLGPTPDDLTTAAIADFFGADLVEHSEIVADIAAKFARRGREMAPSNRKQALLPVGAAVLPNPVGTAPGLIWEPYPGLVAMTFPGVPSEMRRMWTDTALPYLRSRGWAQGTIAKRILRFWGIPESTLAEKVGDWLHSANPTVAPYANRGEVKLRIAAFADTVAEARALVEPTEAALRAIVGLDCYGADEESLASVVGDLLRSRGETLATAESCTGGGLGSLMTAIPGCSAYFSGGVVSYANAAKETLLGVPAATIDRHGAVSPETAEAMAQGVRDRLATTWGLSITGIAGPDGGSETKPIGLVYVGLAGPNHVSSHELRLGSERDRDWIRHVSACSALDVLRRQLSTPKP